MITHDLGVVAGICERVEVMYAGTFVEGGTADEIFDSPRHPYTLGLLESVPRLHTRRAAALNPIPGTPRNMLSPPTSCPFAPRCRYRREHCDAELPQLEELDPGHVAACFYPVDAGAWQRSQLEASA
jgi:oligopeptide transport system ATP-binding protein